MKQIRSQRKWPLWVLLCGMAGIAPFACGAASDCETNLPMVVTCDDELVEATAKGIDGGCCADVTVGVTVDNGCGFVEVTNSYTDKNSVRFSDCFPIGVTVVTFTATDEEGRTASCSTTVLVADETPPELVP